MRLDIYAFEDEPRYRHAHLEPSKLEALISDEVTTIPGCELYWRFATNFFRGNMKEGACSYISGRTGEPVFITDDLKLTKDQLWIRYEAYDTEGNSIFGHSERLHHKNCTVRYFTGWAGVTKVLKLGLVDSEHFSRVLNSTQIAPDMDAARFDESGVIVSGLANDLGGPGGEWLEFFEPVD